jgi:4-alpha-glucanotransferase
MSKFDDSPIVKRYQDALGNWRDVPDDTIASLLDAMGPPTAEAESVLVAQRGEAKGLRAPAEIKLEDRTVLRVATTLPADLPTGYHTLRYQDEDRDTKLIVSP